MKPIIAQKERVKAVIIILVGPLGSRNWYRHMVDTVASVKHYASPDTRIVIQDNSSPLQLGEKLQQAFPELHVSRAPQNYGLYGGLYKSLSLALQYIYDHFETDVIISMDTDALATDFGLEDAAIDFLRENPQVGLMGYLLTGGEGIAWPDHMLRRQLSPFGMLRDYERYRLLRELVNNAQKTGWQLGHHVIGGAAIFNPEFVSRMVKANLLDHEALHRAFLQVDHIFGLLCAACGMQLASFSIPAHPLAVVWRGMPVSPADVVAQGIKVVHSTRAWKDAERSWDEDQIRAFFTERRGAGAPVSPVTPVPLPRSSRKYLRAYLIMKRYIDFVLGSILLVLCIPLMLAVAIAITATSTGPVLVQESWAGARVRGKGGRLSWEMRALNLYSFRTTKWEERSNNGADGRRNAAAVAEEAHQPADTPIGDFLRRTGLYHLPRLLNVVKGDLSLIGPLPVTAEEAQAYSEYALRRFEAQTGFTGWWQAAHQVAGLYTSDAMIAKDIWYVDHQNYLQYLIILLLTPAAILRALENVSPMRNR